MSSPCSGLFSLYWESGPQGRTLSGFVGPFGGDTQPHLRRRRLRAEEEWVGWREKGETQSPSRAGRLHGGRGSPGPRPMQPAWPPTWMEPGTGADPAQGQQRAQGWVASGESAADASGVGRRLSFGVNSELDVKTWQTVAFLELHSLTPKGKSPAALGGFTRQGEEELPTQSQAWS